MPFDSVDYGLHDEDPFEYRQLRLFEESAPKPDPSKKSGGIPREFFDPKFSFENGMRTLPSGNTISLERTSSSITISAPSEPFGLEDEDGFYFRINVVSTGILMLNIRTKVTDERGEPFYHPDLYACDLVSSALNYLDECGNSPSSFLLVLPNWSDIRRDFENYGGLTSNHEDMSKRLRSVDFLRNSGLIDRFPYIGHIDSKVFEDGTDEMEILLKKDPQEDPFYYDQLGEARVHAQNLEHPS